MVDQMSRKTDNKLKREPKLEHGYSAFDFTLKLLLPDNKVVSMPMPERDATLSISFNTDPAFTLRSGDLSVKLNHVVFVER